MVLLAAPAGAAMVAVVVIYFAQLAILVAPPVTGAVQLHRRDTGTTR